MRVVLVVVALSLVADAAPSGGTISGRVSVFDKGKAVTASDVYVYLETVGHKHSSKDLVGAGVTAKISQKNEEFVPHVVVVPVGAEVSFPNLDHQEHNVFSSSEPGFFNLKRYNHDPVGKTQTFRDANQIDIYCDIHRKMQAKIKVIESAFYVEVKNGTFTLANIPPGTYKVVAWVPDSDEVKSEKLVVTEGDKVVLEHELHLQLGRPKPHLRVDGTPYACPPGYADCSN